MTLSLLVFRSMRKNLKQYYLYFFALIFSVTLCFSFTTLQYNPNVVEALKLSGTAAAGFKVASYVLYAIVTLFVLYANQLFMKRRGKEIGLYRLIGMTKGLVVRIIALENMILFVLAVCIGMMIGYFCSRLFAMILLKLLEIEMVITLAFSQQAFKQSVIIFTILLVVIILQLVWRVHRVSLLSLFSATKQADERVKRFSIFHSVMGLLGLSLIAYGYYQSTLLFDVEKSNFFENLYLHMIVILASTIIGTFLFFRYSVALLMNTVRAKKKGHLKVTDVLAVTPIMHRMKGNAKSLTLITLLTGLAVGIMSLSYISYYSSEKSARQTSPYDYILLNNQGTEFLEQLQKEGIMYEENAYEISNVMLNIKDLVSDNLQESPLFDEGDTKTLVIAISELQQLVPKAQLQNGEALITNYVDILAEVLPIHAERDIIVRAGETEVPIYITEIREDSIFPTIVSQGSPILVVTDDLFDEIRGNNTEEVRINSQIGINLVNEQNRKIAEEIFNNLGEERKILITDDTKREYVQPSFEQVRKEIVSSLGLTIFVTAFLGLAFLLTTGSILYFKQIAEAEDEKESYKILRKIGFSTTDILKGIYAKQVFNFGVPLIIGLLHSYFAVKSGWWMFGTELVAPLLIIIGLYIVMYAVFAVLSIQYYKMVVRSSL